MKCPKCQADISEDSHFCSKCGMPLKNKDELFISQTKTIQKPALSSDTVIAGKYKIIEKLGEGGMGVVYKAKDTRLKRPVALKFFPAELTKDEAAKKRFIQEAQAAAALEHPNICTVYEIDEADGQTFIAMSYIEGQSLKDKLKDGPLDIDEAKEIALQVAEGLKEAHEKGIVHRDIKPANIMLTEKGQVKITDFGLAKLSWGLDLTKPATIIGTVAYMSPEQARGGEVDHRTDMWSLGCVLYEMLTGVRPFHSRYDQAVLHAVLHEDPEPLTNLRKDIPARIIDIVSKALEKNPEQRHQSMEQFLNILIKTKEKAEIQSEKKKSIVVLPFENMSADPEQEYFCDGIAEEIINSLTQIEDLRVIARTSAFSFKEKHEDVRDIGRKLGVEALLEGSVRKSGNRLRIATQLINAEDGSHIWSDRFDRQIDDIFDIQDEIALMIMEKLKVKLGWRERDKLVKHPTENVEAYSLYLKGRYFLEMYAEETIKKGLDYFNQAIEKDPSFALAYAGLADHFTWKGVMGFMPSHKTYESAKENAEKALKLDDSLAESHTSMGLVKFYFEWRWDEAEKEFKRAIELNPGSMQAHYSYALYLGLMGRFEESIAEARQALNLDPISPVVNHHLGFILFTARKYDESIFQIRKALELNPNHAYARVVLAWNYAFKMMYSEAIEEGERAEQLSKGIDYWLQGSIACIHAFFGNVDKAITLLDRLKELSEDGYIDPGYFAVLHAAISQKEKAFEWLNKVFEDRSPWMVYLKNYAVTFFKKLSSDPRYSELLKKAGLEIDPYDLSQNLKDISQDFTSISLPPKDRSVEKSIVVLPFEDISPGKDNEYFSDGLTEEIISDLSHIRGLRVISRSSAMTFKRTKKKIAEIADEVNVRYVLEGSVRKAGNDLRITSQLIDAAKDTHLWAEKYSGNLDDVFDIQEKVSNSIVEQLKIKLSPQDVSKIKGISLENVKAYDCYLRARYELMRMSPDSLDRARHFLQKSLDIIGENALLYAILGQAYYWYHDCVYEIDLDPLQEAEKYAKKAYALDPKLAPIHFLFGLIERGKGNLKTAIKHIKKAVEIDPADPTILSLFIWTTSAYAGKTMEMHPYSKYLLDIDPVTPLNYLTVSMLYMAEGHWDKAAEYVRKGVEMDPGLRWGYFWLAQILARARNRKELYAVGDILLEGDSKDIIAQWIRFFKNVYEKDRENALKTLTEDLKKVCWQDPEAVWLMAGCFAQIDERDQALKWLEHAIERGWINYPLFNEIDPFLENIRGEESFKKLMERVKHEWENFEV
jgi:TolB-like protein/Tfp pilus assembly protein PilF/predicted Ser/Thr protein kinase